MIILYALLICPMRATFSARIIILDFMILIIFGEDYKLQISTLRSFLPSPVISSLSLTQKFSPQVKVNVSCPCALTEHHAMKAYWGGGSIAPRMLDGCEWSASRPGGYTLKERTPGTYWI
jgi:hypothetical protein